MKRYHWLWLSLPGIFCLVLVALLFVGLHRDPHLLPSALLHEPAPTFVAEDLEHPAQHHTQAIFSGQVTVLNVFASWCYACRAEHAMLLDAHNHDHVRLVGLDYKDQRSAVHRWFVKEGNPYDLILFDPQGLVAIDWGVYGTPETFIIDQQGVVRAKFVGPIGPARWANTVWPLVQRLQREGGPA